MVLGIESSSSLATNHTSSRFFVFFRFANVLFIVFDRIGHNSLAHSVVNHLNVSVAFANDQALYFVQISCNLDERPLDNSPTRPSTCVYSVCGLEEGFLMFDTTSAAASIDFLLGCTILPLQPHNLLSLLGVLIQPYHKAACLFFSVSLSPIIFNICFHLFHRSSAPISHH